MTSNTSDVSKLPGQTVNPTRLKNCEAGMFFIIGAMKAGTTSLFEHLATHPELYPSPAKEPRFFLLEAPTADERKAYETLFADRESEKWAFEASTGYTKHPVQRGVPARIRAESRDPRFIYMMRDPIDRIYSHYLHVYATGQETRSFPKAIESDAEFLNVSRYSMQLSQYFDEFCEESVHLLVMEEFSQNKNSQLRNVFTFLDVDPNFRPPNVERVYHQTSQRTMLGVGLQRVHYQTKNIRKRLASRPILSGVANRLAISTRPFRKPVPKKSEIRDTAVEQLLREQLREDVEQLEDHLGRRLTCWKTYYGESS